MSFPWDHPRVCGEKSKFYQMAMENKGSPPRVRGKDVFGIFGNVGGGITPACAGKSQRRGFQGFSRKDHPRVCGEKSTSMSMINCGWGSPPRVRGKGYHEETKISNIRITPACAGKS